MGKNDHIFAIQHAIIPSFSTWKHIKCLEVLHTQIAAKLLILAPICRDTRYGNKLLTCSTLQCLELESWKHLSTSMINYISVRVLHIRTQC